jgi:hypothetical protein
MKAVLTAALVICGTVSGLAQTPQCRVCDKPVDGRHLRVEDKVRGGEVEVCSACGNLESRCFACSLPVRPSATKLTDGRWLCPRDAKEAVQDNEEARKICLDTRDHLDRLYSRFLSFPETNVVINIVDRFTLESLFKSPGYGRVCNDIFGAAGSHEVGEGMYVHTISVLSALSRRRLEAVAAHEFAHVWLAENLSPERKATLAPEAVEAFCELIAYQWMEQQGATLEQQAIRASPYTRGQLNAFLAADERHGFNTLLEWVKFGTAARLDAEDSDSVRSARVPPAAAIPAKPPPAVNLPPAPLPEKLSLRGITGTPGHRLAIINHRTFAVHELARLQLAGTNLVVRCLEIRTNSVLIRIEGTGEQQELFLPDE